MDALQRQLQLNLSQEDKLYISGLIAEGGKKAEEKYNEYIIPSMPYLKRETWCCPSSASDFNLFPTTLSTEDIGGRVPTDSL